MAWIDDPRLARQLARGSWVVLVVAFVLLTRSPLEGAARSGAIALVIAVFSVLNAPVALGLSKTRAASHTPAWRAVAAAFGFRTLAMFAVVAFLSTR